MELICKELSKEIRQNLEKLEPHLTLRVRSVMEDFTNGELEKFDKMGLFEILLRFLLRADKEPASLVANLMVPLHNDDISGLEEWTISNSAAFLRDHLRRDYILHILESSGHEATKIKK